VVEGGGAKRLEQYEATGTAGRDAEPYVFVTNMSYHRASHPGGVRVADSARMPDFNPPRFIRLARQRHALKQRIVAPTILAKCWQLSSIPRHFDAALDRRTRSSRRTLSELPAATPASSRQRS